jgi:23S rRNA pseudouridine1911/1915/1917 synthase
VTEFVVSESESGERLDVILAHRLGQSRSRAAARIDAGEVTVDGVVAARSSRPDPGQRVRVAEPVAVAASEPAGPLPPVRYEDADVLVVAKPAGLVVHPGHGRRSGTLVHILHDAGIPLAAAGGPERPGIVHRLDRDTSGLLVVAKTDAAHAGLVAALKARAVGRRYFALVQGVMPGRRGRVDAPIGRDPRDRVRFAAVADGKPAVTHWQVLAEGHAGEHPVTLVGCRLETGRTHQIRVHLAFAGSPVCGDAVYGAAPAIASKLGLARPFLHAADLRFAHPVTGQAIAVTEPLPADLTDALVRAGIDEIPDLAAV